MEHLDTAIRKNDFLNSVATYYLLYLKKFWVKQKNFLICYIFSFYSAFFYVSHTVDFSRKFLPC